MRPSLVRSLRLRRTHPRVFHHMALGMAALSTLLAAATVDPVLAQRPASGPPPFAPLPGPSPTVRDLAYARSDASTGQGHLLDLYLPPAATGPVPVVIFTHGSGWMADNGRMDAQALAAVLHPKGYAVAGVAVRSSAQVQFPGQLYDIKAAIRWLRTKAAKYGLDPAHIGIVGESSGGWTSAMAAVTGDVPELEGDEGMTGVSSAVQVAIAFYPPTDFLQMDASSLRPCDPAATLRPPTSGAPARGPLCHDAPTSPESRLIGCPIQSCPARVQAANPVRYISRADPPIMIVHGESDPLVPHAQGALLYHALSKACHDAVFISLPVAAHGVWYRAWTDSALAAGATRRSTASAGCAVELPSSYTPSWATVVEFLDRYLKPAGPAAGPPRGRMPAPPSIPTPPPACDRACLIGAMDRFLDAVVAGRFGSIPLTEAAEVRENTRALSLDQTIWKDVRTIRSRMTFADELTGNVVARTGVQLDNGRPAYLSTRLKVVAGGKITDVELSADTSSRVVTSYVFALDPKYSEVVPPEQRLERAALDELGRRYFGTLTMHQPAPGDYDERCNRFHSGQQVTNVARNSVEGGAARTCVTSNMGDVPWGPAIEQRFPLIDVEQGVVFGTTLLLYPKMPGAPRMYVSEVFKVVGGKILFIDNIGLMMRDAQTTGFQH